MASAQGQDSSKFKVSVSGYASIPEHKRESVLRSFLGLFGKLKNFKMVSNPSHYTIAEYQEKESMNECIINSGKKVCGCKILIQSHQKQTPNTQNPETAGKKKPPPDDTPGCNIESHDTLMDALSTASDLEEQLQRVVEVLCLTKEDENIRRHICATLYRTIYPYFESVEVHQFGSSINNFGAKGCDLDIFLDFRSQEEVTHRKKRIVVLPQYKDIKSLKWKQGPLTTEQFESMDIYDRVKMLARLISRNRDDFGHAITIPSKRCPLVKVCVKPSGLSCDLSLNSRKALYNSHLLRLYSTRVVVRRVVMAVRLWAKMQSLCDAMCGFSSYAVTFLVLFFLMRRHPPVIPAVKEIPRYVKGVHITKVDSWRAYEIPANARLPESENTESPVTLLGEFFRFYANEIDWDTSILLTSDAKIISHEVYHKTQGPQYKLGVMTMVDPFDHSHNILIRINERNKHRFVHEVKRAVKLSREWSDDAPSPCSKAWGITSLFVPNPHPPEFKTNNSTGRRPGKTFLEGEDENGNFVINLTPAAQTNHLAHHNKIWCQRVYKMALEILTVVYRIDLKQDPVSREDEEVFEAVNMGKEKRKKPDLAGSPKDRDGPHRDEVKAASPAHSDMSVEGTDGQDKDQCPEVSSPQGTISNDNESDGQWSRNSATQTSETPAENALGKQQRCCSSPSPGIKQYMPKENANASPTTTHDPQTDLHHNPMPSREDGQSMNVSPPKAPPCMVSGVTGEMVSGAKRSSVEACLDKLSPVFKPKQLEGCLHSLGGEQQDGKGTHSTGETTPSISNLSPSRPVFKKVKLVSYCRKTDENAVSMSKITDGSGGHGPAGGGGGGAGAGGGGSAGGGGAGGGGGGGGGGSAGGGGGGGGSSLQISSGEGTSSSTVSILDSVKINPQTVQESLDCTPSSSPSSSSPSSSSPSALKSGAYTKMSKFACSCSFPMWIWRSMVKNMRRKHLLGLEGLRLEKEISRLLFEKHNSIGAMAPNEHRKNSPTTSYLTEQDMMRRRSLLKLLKKTDDKSKKQKGHSKGETSTVTESLAAAQGLFEFSCLFIEKCLPEAPVPQVQVIFRPHPDHYSYFKNFFISACPMIKRLVSNHLYDND